MPLYKSFKPSRKPKLISSVVSRNLNREKPSNSLSIVEAKTYKVSSVTEEEKAIEEQITDSPVVADGGNKTAETPAESASVEIKNRAGKETEKNKNETKAQRKNKKESAKKAKNEEVLSDDSQNSEHLSISQQYLLMEKIVEPSPPENASKKERLEWLQKERNVGLYVQCDNCDKFRYLEDVMDPTELPEKWYCFMNMDVAHKSCEDPEVKVSAREEEDMIFNEYNAGSVVWAKLPPYPWWPAMVDDNPYEERYYRLKNFSDFPTHYNVAFFDSELVNIAWIRPKFLKPFRGNENMFSLKETPFQMQFVGRFDVAKRQAIEALSCDSILDRLKKFSFIARWVYKIDSYPTNNNKKTQKRKKNNNNNNNTRNANNNEKKRMRKDHNKRGVDNKRAASDTDEPNEETTWEKNVNNSFISVSFSPDISFDLNSY